MLWMETYLTYCSVRLGVMVVALLVFLQLFIPAILLFVYGTEYIDPIVNLVENDDHYNKNAVVRRILDWMANDTENFLLILNVILFTHMACCILAFYGAIRLQKWFLAPFIFIELQRVILCLAFHIILMIMLKKILNLGVLVAFTLAGGFLILYLGYNWTTSVALFQIIQLVKCERYKTIYGNDPLHPQLTAQAYYNNLFAFGTVENVRVLITPNDNDIDELKQKQSNIAKVADRTSKQQPIIAVLPANYSRVAAPSMLNNVEKQQNIANQAANANKMNDYSVSYANWQWMELLGGAKKPSTLIGQNW